MLGLETMLLGIEITLASGFTLLIKAIRLLAEAIERSNKPPQEPKS